ncbi:hypothetical protein Ab1vBOLIVR4_gp24c [Agrobacterium phage OLIVR4]|nr:hypothetical protein Ab1vBOLIVR4_gp24c [Agrobacterium phage OLIVR4]
MIQLRPSSAFKWGNCALNPRFEELAGPEETTDAAREGTCAAWVAECVLRGDAYSAEDLVGRNHSNGWLVTMDMAYYVQKYINHVRSRGGVISAEQRVIICAFIQGTLDSSSVTFTGDTLYVDDLKFGMEPVDVFENPQLILYGGGEYLRLGRPVNIRKVRLGIFQPRAFHHEGPYRYWELSIPDLMTELQKLIEAGQRVQEPGALATPGPWCRRCTGAKGCEALTHSSYRLYEFISKSANYRELTDEEIAAELDAIDLMSKLIKARRAALEPDAESRLRSRGLRGYILKDRKGNRAFKYSAGVIKAMTGIDPAEDSLCTPAELERRGARPDIVEFLSHRPNLPKKMERLTDKEMRRIMDKKDK